MLRKDRSNVAVWSHSQQANVEDDIVELSRVRLRGLIKVEAAVARRHLVNSIGAQLQRLAKHIKSLLGVPIWIVGGHESLVSPPELDP
jgi:hypothetical protein